MADSEIAAIRALLGAKPRPVGWVERRQRIDEVCSVWPVADDIRLEPVDIAGMPGEWSLAPGSDPSRVLLFFHGGGYCSGSILSHRRMVSEAGRAAKVRTLAIGGDSAGGGLTVSLICRLREAGEALPGCAWLVSPWTDLTLSGATLATKDSIDPLIHKPYLKELADAYLPADMDRRDPRVSPLFADLRGLPATPIQVGSAETLLADATRFAEAAGAAAVPVTLQIFPEMIHAWHVWNAKLKAGRRALAAAGDFIRRHL